MLERLGQSMLNAIQRMAGRGVMTEQDLKQTLRDVRVALLEADVVFPVIKNFLAQVEAQAIGQKLLKSVRPDQLLMKIVYDEMMALLDNEATVWALGSSVMCVGLQGSGKTTLCSKLAYLFREKKEKVLLVSLDPYRPGAQEQLRILAEQVGVDPLPVIAREDVRDTAKRALAHSKTYDRIIFDTAGRLHIDQALMKELHDLDKIIQAKEVLLVCDSLMGQSVKDVVEAFSELPLSGVALSKLDANHKAGILLSLKFLLKKPVKVLGTGEKPEDVMAWDAKRLVGRILDQGDITELVQRTTQAVSLETQEKQFDRLKQGIFTLDDLITQLDAMNKMGGLNTILKFIPGMRNVSAALQDKDTSFKKEKAMLSSMTSKERKNPKILNASRKLRIAKGSGTQVSDLNQLLSRFEQMKKMLQQFSKISR